MKMSNKNMFLNKENRKNFLFIFIGSVSIMVFLNLFFLIVKSEEQKPDLLRENYMLEDTFDTGNAQENWKETIQTQEVSCVFWNDLDKKNVENPDYKKNIIVKTIEVCGNSAVLFPNENYVKEKGYCLLGRTTAVNLFGSTAVNGRNICVEGQQYCIAGVLQKQTDIVVLESDEGKFENVSYLYHNDFEKGKNMRIIEGICGSKMTQAVRSPDSQCK